MHREKGAVAAGGDRQGHWGPRDVVACLYCTSSPVPKSRHNASAHQVDAREGEPEDPSGSQHG